MSSSVTVRPVRGVRGIGLFTIIVGIVMILAGGTTYAMVTSQLRDEQITVSDDAQFLAGWRVQDPLTAYSQAEVINKHALASTDGKRFAQLPQDDPRRATVMNGSFLRASLFTSVVAFGVAILVVVLGVLFLLVGIALRRLGRGDVSVLGVVPASQAASAGSSEQPAPAQPVAPVVPPERTSSRHAAAPEVASEQSTTPSAAPRGPLPTEPDAPSRDAGGSAGGVREEEARGAAETGDVPGAVEETTTVEPPSEPGPARPEDGTTLPEDGTAR